MGGMLFTLAASVVQIQPPRQYPIYKNIHFELRSGDFLEPGKPADLGCLDSVEWE